MNNTAQAAIAGKFAFAQTFTVGSTNHTVTSIELYMFSVNNVTGNLVVDITATDGGLPTGPALATGTYPISNISPLGSEIEIEGFGGYELSANTMYAIVCHAPDCNPYYGWLTWYFASSGGYNKGNAVQGYGTWSQTSFDCYFKVYGTPTGPTPTPTPTPNPSPSPEPEAPTYTVWKSGPKYYAKDAHGDPVPEYESGSDSASVIINACVDAISTGGEIAIREGEFICTGTIYVTGKAILFKGTGKGEIGQAGTILTFNSSFNGFDINVNPGNVYTTSVTIEDMLIHGAPSTGTAIKSKGRYLTIRHVDIEQFGVGISLEMADGYSAGDSLIDDCVIRHCEYQGVLISSNDNRMSNVFVHHCWQGLELSGFSGGLNAYNIHLWGNTANGLLITNSSKDFFYNLQCDEDANYNVVITPRASQNEYVRDIKFMNCFFWSDKKETVNPTYSGALYFGGDRPIDNVSIIGGKIGIPGFKAYTKMKKVGNNAIGTFIRMVDLNDATNDPIYPFTTGSSTSDIYLCQGITP